MPGVPKEAAHGSDSHWNGNGATSPCQGPIPTALQTVSLGPVLWAKNGGQGLSSSKASD